ncbi:MAG: 30S ribosomal protein S4 [Fimbriimonadales bacterium]
MSVVWESRCRYCRRALQKLYLKGDRCHTKKCAMEREQRVKVPGQHGQVGQKPRVSEYGEQLSEKQKLKRMYQLREGQFSKYMELAQRRRGPTGENLLQLLEMRLDNVVYRLGWAASRGMARQMVSHRFFTVNGRRVSVPSIQLRPNDVVELHPSKRETSLIKSSLARMATHNPGSWLALDANTFAGRVLHAPARDEVTTDIKEQMIVEYYTR